MLVRELPILKAKADLQFRDKIYRAWHDFLEGEAERTEFACFYFYLKNKLGIQLSHEEELRLVGESSRLGRKEVTKHEIQAAEECGVFENLAPGFSRWQAVLWGKLACAALFASYGVNGQAFLEDLDLHLIRGQQRIQGRPEGMATVHELALKGHDLAGIAQATGKSRAMICACIWHLAA